MLPLVMAALRTYAPYVIFPAALVIGFIGYHMEGALSDRYTPYTEKSIKESREDRRLDEILNVDATNVESVKDKRFIPKTIFLRNVSP
uniref:Small integral membrane protein 12 n=1 Tax=Strigamia maritima TaxID=126957 RepID=T1JGN7_STRMM